MNSQGTGAILPPLIGSEYEAAWASKLLQVAAQRVAHGRSIRCCENYIKNHKENNAARNRRCVNWADCEVEGHRVCTSCYARAFKKHNRKQSPLLFKAEKSITAQALMYGNTVEEIAEQIRATLPAEWVAKLAKVLQPK